MTKLQTARKHINLFAASARAPSNWADTLTRSYERAYHSLLLAEDELGIEATGALSDRLTSLRQKAGLSPEEIITAENAALERADAAKT